MLDVQEFTGWVKVVDLLDGSPPALVVTERVPWGKDYRTFTQKVNINDVQLAEYLRREVQVGEEIEITIVNDWSRKDIPAYVKSFSKVRIKAS